MKLEANKKANPKKKSRAMPAFFPFISVKNLHGNTIIKMSDGIANPMIDLESC
jgi:hypothetical protein